MLVLLCVLIIFIMCDGIIYNVIPTQNDTNCPTDQECHTLSYYMKHANFYFISDTAFVFMEGEHLLNMSVNISGVDSLTLLGSGQRITGFHNSVMQSTTVIRCSRDIVGFEISDSKLVVFKNIAVTECRNAFKFIKIATLYFVEMSVQNCSSAGFLAENINNITIHNTSFAHNNIRNITEATTFVGNAQIISNSNNQQISEVDIYNITSSNFSFGESIQLLTFTGGLFIRHTSDSSHKLIMNIEDCQFYNNTGTLTGGLQISGGGGELNLKKSLFLDNIATLHSFGMTAGGASFHSLHTRIYNCTFFGNFKGGLLIDRGLDVNIIHTLFVHNIDFSVVIIVVGDINANLDSITVSNSHCSSLQNRDQFMASVNLYCDDNSAVITQNSVIHDNEMSGIMSARCVLIFNQHTIIANNSSPFNGGGIIIHRGFVYGDSNSKVSFINNTASMYGGALYSLEYSLQALSDIDLKVGHSNRFIFYFCTFTFYASFIDNSATCAGDNIYGGNTFNCFYNTSLQSVFPTPIYFHEVINCEIPLYKTAMSNTQSSLSLVSSDPIGVCQCFNGTIDCNTRSSQETVYPGQVISISLVTVGLCAGVSPGTVVTTSSKGINLTFSERNQVTGRDCKTFNFIVKRVVIDDIISPSVEFSISQKNDLIDGSLIINLTVLQCPLGLKLDNVSSICDCDPVITESVSGVNCNVSWMPYPIRRSGNNWIEYFEQHNCIVAHTGCPFDYCDTSKISFNLMNISELQCNNNRSGIICGECQPGLSLLLGSNKCQLCTNNYIAVNIGFLIAGVLLIVVLITLNLTVSIGSINGLLLYANIVKLNETVFFPNGSIPVLNQFISWLNLDLGIETCLYNGLDGYTKAWLQFVFPLYVWLLMIGLIIGCHYSVRLTRLCGRNIVPVLATLVLMSYTKLLRNITNVLMFTTLKCGDLQWRVWSIDGNIKYLSGKHILLFIVSLLFLVVGLIYTILVFSAQWLQRCSGKCFKSSRDPVVKLKPFIDAYTGPYKDKFKFWTGLLLIIRIILTAVFSFTSGSIPKLNNYFIIITLLFLHLPALHIYRDTRLAILDIIHYTNLGFFAVLRSYTFDDINSQIITKISVSISLFVFIITILSHCKVFWRKKCKLPKFRSFRLQNKYESEDEVCILEDTRGDDDDNRNDFELQNHISSLHLTMEKRNSLLNQIYHDDPVLHHHQLHENNNN